MAKQEVELFLHQQGAKPKVIVAGAGETLREVLIRSGIIKEGQDDILVFVGECAEALKEPDDVEEGSDQHAPVDVNLTLEVLEIERHHHVHAHGCKHILVEVNFVGKTKRRKFSPATTIETVTAWARKKLRMDAAAASEYVLQLCHSTEQPRSDRHLGELADKVKCSLCFDLVKEITPQG